MFAIGIFVNVGMWMERFVIIVTSLSRDFLPSSWHHYAPTWVDFSILIGSFGFFFTWVLLFTKALPVVSMAEVKAVVKGSQPTHRNHS
jgi:molybdopterin-containing oxidoreductase family membrane subunit